MNDAELLPNSIHSDLTAEQSLLGSIIIDSRCLAMIGDVTEDDFEYQINRDTFNAIAALRAASEEIDTITVRDKMRESGSGSDEALKYILELMSITPTAENARYYSQIVRTNSVNRQIQTVMESQMGKRDRNAKIKELQKRLEDIEAGGKWASITAKPASSIKPSEVPKLTIYIDGILTEGVYFMNGFSKVGKSRLMLQMLLALSTGEKFLDRETKKCSVLYLALEDEHVDYQNRMLDMLHGSAAPDSFFALTKEDFPDMITPTLDSNGGLIELIENHIRMCPEIKVIGIDVFTIIRSKSTHNPVADDNRDVTTLMRVAAKHKIAIIVAHHVSKTDLRASGNKGSSIGSGAGTFSLSGTVIGEFELSKDNDNCFREKGDMLILRTGGRRIRASSFSLISEYPRFNFMGYYDDVSSQMSAAKTSQMDNALIETIACIYSEDVVKSGKKSWRGSSSAIYEYNIMHGDLPPMTKSLNKNSFNDAVLLGLKAKGILCKSSSNGQGAPTWVISGVDSIYKQDSIKD